MLGQLITWWLVPSTLCSLHLPDPCDTFLKALQENSVTGLAHQPLLIVQRPSSESPVPTSRHSETGVGNGGQVGPRECSSEDHMSCTEQKDPERKWCPWVSYQGYGFKNKQKNKTVEKFMGKGW